MLKYSQVHEHDTVVNDLLKQTTKCLATLLELYIFPTDNLYPSKSMADFAKLKTGDHLMYKCTNGWYIHYYVQSINGDDSVQVRGWFLKGNDNPLVEQELFTQPDKLELMELGMRTLKKDEIDTDNLSICVYTNENDNTIDERMEEFSLWHKVYNLLSNNSEHFVTFLKMGRATCYQYKSLEHVIVQELIIQGGPYGFIPTVLAAIRLGVLQLLVSFFEVVSSRVVQKTIENMTKAVANVTLDLLVVNFNEKSVDEIAQEVGIDIIKALAQEITKNDEALSKEIVQHNIEELCKEILTNTTTYLLEKHTSDSGKGIADHIATQGLDVVIKEIVTRAMEDLARDLVKKGIIEIETDFLEHLAEEGTAEGIMKEILGNGKMAVIEQLTDEVVKKATSSTAYHVAKNAIKSNITTGVVVEGVFYTAGMLNAGQKYYKGEMDGNDFVEFTVEHTVSSSGSLAGGIGGSIAGAAAGAAIGSVVPAIGTTIGAGVGGFIGGMGGGVSGSLAGLGMGKLINWMWK